MNDSFWKEKIGSAINLTGLTDEEQEKILGNLLAAAKSRFNIAVMERLSEEERAVLIDIVEKSDHDETAIKVLAYLRSKIPDLDNLRAKVIDAVIEDFKRKTG